MESILFQRIQGLCKARGITLTKLSEDLGIGLSLIRKWKTSTSPSIDKVKAIAEYFDVSVDYLVGMSDFEESADKVLQDKDFISLQRAKQNSKAGEWELMMKMIQAGFDHAFREE